MIVTCVTTIISLYCDDGDSRKHLRTEFQDLEGPKGTHELLEFLPMHDSTRPVSASPTPGAGLLVRVIRNSQAFSASDKFGGQVIFSDSGTIALVITGTPGDTITVGVALPPGMRLKPIASGNVLGVTVMTRDRPDFADQEVIIATQNTTYLWFVWKVSSAPLSIGPFGNNLRLEQEQLPSDSIHSGRNFMKPVRLRMVQGPFSQDIPVGQVVTLGTSNYTAFVQSSLFEGVADRGGDAKEGYILRAIVVEQ